MNTIPPGAIPKLWRQRNNSGNEVGSWYITVKKKPVNLKTKDYMRARERAREAYYNDKRDFPDDRYSETLALPPMESERPQIAQPVSKPSGDWTSDVVDAAGAGLRPEVFPAGEPPPRVELPQNSPSSEEKKDDFKIGGDGKTRISPEMIAGIIKQMASVLVELQITMQDYLWAKWAKIEAGPVPPTHQSRAVSEELWQQAIREWIPPELPIPAWLLAPLICASLTIPVQLENAKPIKKPTEPIT
jgi:hypothetical protein